MLRRFSKLGCNRQWEETAVKGVRPFMRGRARAVLAWEVS